MTAATASVVDAFAFVCIFALIQTAGGELSYTSNLLEYANKSVHPATLQLKSAGKWRLLKKANAFFRNEDNGFINEGGSWWVHWLADGNSPWYTMKDEKSLQDN